MVLEALNFTTPLNFLFSRGIRQLIWLSVSEADVFLGRFIY